MAQQQAPMPPVPPPGQADSAAVGVAEQTRLMRLHGGTLPQHVIGAHIMRVHETVSAALAQGAGDPAQPVIQQALQPVMQLLEQLQAGQVQMQAQMRNLRLRALNARAQQDNPQQLRPLAPLVKEQPPPAGGGAAAVGALPPANIFPATWLAVGQLSDAQLDALEAFYGEPFAPGAVLAQRRAAFEAFIK